MLIREVNSNPWSVVGDPGLPQQCSRILSQVRFIDVGGGLGIPEKPGQSPLN